MSRATRDLKGGLRFDLAFRRDPRVLTAFLGLSLLVSRGGSPYNGLCGEAPPERGAFFKLAVYKRVGKIAILVYERVTKSAAKW